MLNFIIKIRSITINLKKEHFLFFSYVLSIGVVIIVYITGGTYKVYANLMYLPVSIIASTNGKKQGMIHAIISALMLGPFMPLYVDLDIMQEPINWIVRLIIYFIIATLIGYFADYYKQEIEKSQKYRNETADAKMTTIYALVKLAESRDDDTGEHTERVAEYCTLLAKKLKNIPKYQSYIIDSYIETIYKVSQLHDIGKVGIPDRILLKPGKLTADEFEIMKSHTTIGAETLEGLEKQHPGNLFLKLGINVVHFHHEKWDGTGYPLGLAGEQIPLAARIMALADVYDALRTKRVYKEAYSHNVSLEIIKQSSGSHFDPEIVNVFVMNEDEFKSIYENQKNI